MEITWQDEEASPSGQRTKRILLAAAILPWLIVIAVLLTPRSAATTSVQPPTEPVHPAIPQPDTAIPNLPPVYSAPSLAPVIQPSLAHRAEIEALALLIASEYLRSPEQAFEDMVFEQLVVEAVDTTSPSVAIVAVLAQFRTVEGTAILRLAVPVGTGQTSVARSLPPYQLPGNYIGTQLPDVDQLTQVSSHTAADKALSAAGYQNADVVRFFIAPGWPALAVVSIDTPIGPQETIVLLHDTGDGYVVAGASPTAIQPTGELTEVFR